MNNEKVLKILLTEYPQAISIKNHDGNLPLHLAALTYWMYLTWWNKINLSYINGQNKF